MLTLATKQT
jgi:hypothetical protein